MLISRWADRWLRRRIDILIYFRIFVRFPATFFWSRTRPPGCELVLEVAGRLHKYLSGTGTIPTEMAKNFPGIPRNCVCYQKRRPLDPSITHSLHVHRDPPHTPTNLPFTLRQRQLHRARLPPTTSPCLLVRSTAEQRWVFYSAPEPRWLSPR